MSILLSRVVACEEDFQASDFDEEHGSSKNVACRVWCDSDGGDGVGGIVVDSLYLRKGVEVILFGVERL